MWRPPRPAAAASGFSVLGERVLFIERHCLGCRRTQTRVHDRRGSGGAVSWKSRRQDRVSLSTSEAEYVAASQWRQEVLYLREILRDFGYPPLAQTRVYEDNLACIAMSENPLRRKFSRHIDIRRYFVREFVAHKILTLVPLRTHMVADALTKSLPAPAHTKHRDVMIGKAPFCARTLRTVRSFYT